MSKSLNHYARPEVASPAVGALVRNTVRMGLYWLCTTVLLWPGLDPLVRWQPRTLAYFLLASSLVVPALGSLSGVVRSHFPQVDPGYAGRSLSQTLYFTGVVAVEMLLVVLSGLTLSRLLF